jgi:O-antigen/teichoic acid export membrane protein
MADKSHFANEAQSPHSRAAFIFTLKLAIPNTLAAGLFVLGVALFSEELIAIAYGPKFAYANSSLLAWLPLFLIMSACLPFEALVYARKEFRRYYFVRAVASVVAVGLTLPLVLLWDSVGAILACGVGSLIAMTGTLLLLWGRR